jgi:type III pantothenate kinase
MANLVIDIGNTFTKAAIFEQDELVYTDHYTVLDNQILDGSFN